MENLGLLIVNKKYVEGKGYLLGVTKEREWVYLGKASWDCDWYWGFGYIGTYRQNSHYQSSHTHWDSDIIGDKEEYNWDSKTWSKRKYVNHLNDNKNFKSTTLTNAESWKLAELMKTFYILKQTANLYHQGSAHVTDNPLREVLKNKKEYNRINKVLLPALFEEIYKLLTPDSK